MPYFHSRKRWTGWDLNPRPQHLSKMLFITCLKGAAMERELLKSVPLVIMMCHRQASTSPNNTSSINRINITRAAIMIP